MLAVKGMWDPYVRIQVWETFSMNLISMISYSRVRGATYLGFCKKVRNDNSIFLITQLHTKTYLGLCETSMIVLF